jgi:hypothetical protein
MAKNICSISLYLLPVYIRLSFPENLQEYKCYQSETQPGQNGKSCTSDHILYKIIMHHLQRNTIGKGDHFSLVAHPDCPGAVTQKKDQRNHGWYTDVGCNNDQRFVKSKYDRQRNGYGKLKSPQWHNAHKYTEAHRTCLYSIRLFRIEDLLANYLS